MQRLRFPQICLIVFAAVSLGLAVLASDSKLQDEPILSSVSLQPSAATHETRTGFEQAIEFPNASEIVPRIETVSSASPTRRTFMATWASVPGANGYLLDVSTSNSFGNYVDGY